MAHGIPERVQELGIGPVSDAVCRIVRDVRGIEDAGTGLERLAAREDQVIPLDPVADGAARRAEDDRAVIGIGRVGRKVRIGEEVGSNSRQRREKRSSPI